MALILHYFTNSVASGEHCVKVIEDVVVQKFMFAISSPDEFFYSAPQCSHCKRCTSYGNSVCLSVRLSHAGIVSKRRHLAQCSLNCRIAKSVYFCRNQKMFPRDDPFFLKSWLKVTYPKSWLKVTYPLLIAASLDMFYLVAPQR